MRRPRNRRRSAGNGISDPLAAITQKADIRSNAIRDCPASPVTSAVRGHSDRADREHRFKARMRPAELTGRRCTFDSD